jgi:hypothetical protein
MASLVLNLSFRLKLYPALSRHGHGLWQHAVRLGKLGICSSLVESGVSIEGCIDSCGGCTLVLAALNMFHDEIARCLISKGAPTAGQVCEKWDTRGYSAVHLASRKESQIDILRSLLLKDLQLGSPCFRSPVHPTHIAVACGNNVGLGAIIQHIRSQAGAPEPSAICASTLDTSHHVSRKGLHCHMAPLRLSSKISGRKGIWQRQPASPLLDHKSARQISNGFGNFPKTHQHKRSHLPLNTFILGLPCM